MDLFCLVWVGAIRTRVRARRARGELCAFACEMTVSSRQANSRREKPRAWIVFDYIFFLKRVDIYPYIVYNNSVLRNNPSLKKVMIGSLQCRTLKALFFLPLIRLTFFRFLFRVLAPIGNLTLVVPFLICMEVYVKIF